AQWLPRYVYVVLVSATLHRYLHSFPTRRSSDLGRLAHRLLRVSGAGLRRCQRRSVGRCALWRREILRRLLDALAQRIGAAADAADRKSTRLNSCHLVISYAVFCLKKKKTY